MLGDKYSLEIYYSSHFIELIRLAMMACKDDGTFLSFLPLIIRSQLVANITPSTAWRLATVITLPLRKHGPINLKYNQKMMREILNDLIKLISQVKVQRTDLGQTID